MKNMKILVLGGNGFIGKNLCKYISSMGHDVISFDMDYGFRESTKITYVKGDFFQDDDLIPYLKDVDVVFHAISTINPGNSNNKYMQGYTHDFLQSVKLCDLSKQYHFKIIYLSSGGTVYGFQTHMPIDEETLAIPINHYGNLKLCIENTFRTFNKQFNTNVIIARIANPYGPGQDYSKGVGFIDAALKRAINNQTIEIWGDGTVIRDYIYIDDVCHMLASLIYYEGKESVFNISSNSGVSQNEIIKIIHKMVPDISVKYLPARSVDVPAIILNNTKILSVCKEQCIEIEEGITKYYKYLQNLI
ncbi:MULTISPECIES: NAD-dependent epimerase/dehydratase family protein [Hungatella]|uniref:NAD-dependent epimerase/dehydratase family protein n=1 Tax=Hungatella hathewayi TaxID=154046 RepID=A0A3E4TMZ0_9FIRM|nr:MULTISPECIES: NAD-dependent epimerase/dehydratase family protein [Hungatella]RGL91917.1 NAD-dependent epimerase/dehydratase family protein [Hungatella hathewayi]RHM66701.1 NAD-dependent epimerase/dehydratase family protein [Hungatella hathewayi]